MENQMLLWVSFLSIRTRITGSSPLAIIRSGTRPKEFKSINRLGVLLDLQSPLANQIHQISDFPNHPSKDPARPPWACLPRSAPVHAHSLAALRCNARLVLSLTSTSLFCRITSPPWKDSSYCHLTSQSDLPSFLLLYFITFIPVTISP